MFLITAVTPLREAWFQGVSGLSDALLPFTRVPVLILTVVPGLLTLKSWLRGRYVHHKRTGVMAYAVAVYTVFLAVGVSAGAAFLAVPGAVLTAICMSAAQFVENGYLVLANPNRAGTKPA
jgi:Cu/Ag efflux pump CusA